MADRPGSLESVGRVSNGRHPRLMSCDECPRWTRSPSSSSSSSSCPPASSFLCSSFFRTRVSLSRSPFRPSILRSFRRGSSRFLAQERIPYDGLGRVSPFRSANRKLETSDRAQLPATIKRYVPPLPHRNRPAKYADPSWIHAEQSRGRALCTSQTRFVDFRNLQPDALTPTLRFRQL